MAGMAWARHGAVLSRTTFATNRLLEFFTEQELTMQIGHPRRLWPLALVKELIDNALDACETAGIAPVISVSIQPDAITVQDNGPGLPAATLERSLDYLVRVSDKTHYASPTRGQLGNALKCVWAAPYVVDGEAGCVYVATHGETHRIAVRLDRIAQAPQIEHTVSPAPLVKTGTQITVGWDAIASCLDDRAPSDFYKGPAEIPGLHALMSAYAMCNPHAAFRLDGPHREGAHWPATNAAWQKWRPSDPTSPHWYSAERLGALIAAYLADEQAGGKPRTVREFIAEFRGLSSTTKQKVVAEAAGLSGARLHDLVAGADLDLQAVGRLLRAMQEASRPVSPAALGELGAAHLTQYLTEYCHVAPESVQYRRVREVDSRGLPFVLEVAFGVYTPDYEECGRAVITGVNWTPAITIPFREMPQLLGVARADPQDPVVAIAHLACPRVEFTDRGKGQLADAH
jgi:DNA topoisomerase VI subunit B